MKTVVLKRVDVEMIAVTRFLFGAGCALLLGHTLAHGKRQVVGWILSAIGAITTFPFILLVYGKKN